MIYTDSQDIAGLLAEGTPVGRGFLIDANTIFTPRYTNDYFPPSDYRIGAHDNTNSKLSRSSADEFGYLYNCRTTE